MRIEIVEEGRNSKSPDIIEGNDLITPLPLICRMAKVIELLK